ncbi:MAG: hypothetical protein HY094_04985 [Candidatus Melainabacteria bacterium]|nr:hypothetical protein [Candidatus Melainabacteria bacterium]
MRPPKETVEVVAAGAGIVLVGATLFWLIAGAPIPSSNNPKATATETKPMKH